MQSSAGNDNFTHFADFYQPFLIDESHVRGNFIRLGDAVDTILHRHNYPKVVSKMLGEQIVLACMLSGKLKERGSLTMQVKGSGEGPVKFTVVDVNAEGDVRGYAELADDVVDKLAKLNPQSYTLQDLVGEKGYLAITINTGKANQQYQGIVGLVGESLTDAISEYFGQSEQVGVSIKVAVGHNPKKTSHQWFASGMMLQRVPAEGGKKRTKKQMMEEEENWNRATILMGTVKDDELLNPELPAQTLLQRLFNEDGVWVYQPKRLAVGCRCSRARVEDTLAHFSAEDLEEMKMDGVISVNCQFCNKTEIFGEDEITEIKKRPKK